MKLKLKHGLQSALGKPDAEMLARALDNLADMSLDAQVRWRVRQIENALCEKPGAGGMDEP